MRQGLVFLAWALTLAQGEPGTAAGPVDRAAMCRETVDPGEGDILFFTDRSFLWRVGYALAWTAPPYHVGIVVRRPDGRLAALESGPDDFPWVLIQDLDTRLRNYDGKIWVRKARRPPGPEASARLTAFAVAQEGKHFATGRMILAATPLRHRGPIRSRINTRPHGDRPRWFCSELALEAAVGAGLIPWDAVRPAATYPRDMFYDRWISDLSPYYEPPVRWCPGR